MHAGLAAVVGCRCCCCSLLRVGRASPLLPGTVGEDMAELVVPTQHTATEPEPVAAQLAVCSGHRFDIGDPAWQSHLAEQGFCVIKGVADERQVCTGRALFWDDIEASNPTVRRDDVDTWRPGPPRTGNASVPEHRRWMLSSTGLVSGSLAQGAGAWQIRGLPLVKQAFSQIWGDEDLIVSMDCALIWRPWAGRADCGVLPQTEGLHLDQNPYSKPDLECVQGMVPLYDVTPFTGGLAVIPCSHVDKAPAWCKQFAGQGDWCPLSSDDPMQGAERLVVAAAGDLILWDARTVHGGVVGPGEDTMSADGTPALARLTQTVSMTPRSRASEACLKARRDGFAAGITFNHSPHESGVSSGTVPSKRRRDFRPPQLTEQQAALI